MMQLRMLEDGVIAALPGVRVEHVAPLRATGFHHVDFWLGERIVVVKWRDDIRFRVAEIDDDSAFDAGPATDVATVDEAIALVIRLLAPAARAANQ